SADREVGLLAQIVAPVSRSRDPDAHERADEIARELAVLSVRLHALLVKTGLRGMLGS
ncbi:MAG: MerR family transcriptional regulator, partial [Actinomycetota bacterium]|nr:MerR family transcriptional regulator [Actinomycetota bacterium]